MTWLQRYTLRHYLQTSIWVLPAFGIVAALLSVRGFDWIEQIAGWQLESGANSVRDLLGTLAGSMFTFIVFLSSTLLLVVQLASAQLHHLLRSVGGRHLDDGRVSDPSGTLRLVYSTPNWEDFVCLAVTEIRQYGGTSIQVARRLRAMLENLTEVLPPERTSLLRDEMKLLQRSARRCFPDPEDRALAEVGDLQGVGGKPPGG